MDVLDTALEPSVDHLGWSRLRATVRYDDGRSPPESYWFEVPSRYESFLSRSGNPWVTSLLPLAVSLGEPLRVPVPVDDILLDNIHELMRIWRCWYPALHEIEVEAPRGEASLDRSVGRTASLFSAGVDAFFTLLSHEPGSSASGSPLAALPAHIDDLLCVWGLDIGLKDADAFARLSAESARVAQEFGKESIPLATNLRSTRLNQAGWGLLYHGPLLASLGHALEGRLTTLLIPSSDTYAHLEPWGSHPLTDPLLSTRQLSVRHDGAAFTRVAKTRLISAFEAPHRSLRVCWSSGGFGNCGSCVKCYRTMTTLYLLGILSDFPTFPGDRYDERRLSQFWSRDASEKSFWFDLIELALEVGRPDLARLIERGLRRGPGLSRLYRVASWLRAQRVLEPLSRPLRRRLKHWVLRDLVYDDLPSGPVAAR